jgi:hypothetical protein
MSNCILPTSHMYILANFIELIDPDLTEPVQPLLRRAVRQVSVHIGSV